MGRLFLCKGGGYYFSKQNPQDSERWQGGSQLFQHHGLHLHCGTAACFYHWSVFRHFHETGTGSLCRPDGKANSVVRRSKHGNQEELFDFLCSQIEGADNISYSIDASYKSPTPSGMHKAIQLGNPFYITIEGNAKLGGFWNFRLIQLPIVARGAGVSEHYWKWGGQWNRFIQQSGKKSIMTEEIFLSLPVFL